jgi:PAS domain S-box-containing protein
LQHSRFRSAAAVRRTLIAVIALLSVGGYLLTSETIRSDRRSAAARRAEIESVRTAELLDRARAYVVGLGNILVQQPVAGPRRFDELVGGTAGSAGLVDALWLQSVPASGRLTATYTTGTRPALRPGVDVSGWPVLAHGVRDLATVFAVTASSRAVLGTEPGFYLLERTSFGRGRGSAGYLAVFVPRGWLILSLGDDPREVAISLDGHPLEGRLGSAPAAGASFQALARSWRVAVVAGAPSGLQSLLPWFARAWPIAGALVAFLVGNAVVRRRRAEREAERIFDLSLDLLGIASLDGYFTRVNPAFERTLGYPRETLLARPLFDFIHPEDVERSRRALESLGHGHQLVQFENRYVRSDGSLSWLEWNVRPERERGVVYVAARDVTDRRQTEMEQAALRRVATLVARRAPPEEVFAAVTEEVGQLFPVDFAGLSRYEHDGMIIYLAVWARTGKPFPPAGTRVSLGGKNVTTLVFETGRPARIDNYADSSGPLAVDIRKQGIRSAVGTPITVEGRLWGAIGIGSILQRPLPPDTEARLGSFTELVATAIANAESRAALAASRARIVAATDETRRRIERDLHDGTQQRLVSLMLELRAAEAAEPSEVGELRARVSEAVRGLGGVLEELQELSRGIHPAILSKGGLERALRALARRSAVPVELDLRGGERPTGPVEVAAYYVASEALNNAAKHAHASVVQVELDAEDSVLRLAIRDDGIGGADPRRGSGLLGLGDRVEALGGTLQLVSPTGSGTTVLVEIPLDGRSPGSDEPR